ncbi:MAG: type II restriction endonuclease [Nanoarchaeota archaeon]
MINLELELYNAVKDLSWNFVGILDTNKKLHPIPKNLNFQALFEKLVFERISILKNKYNIDVIDPNNIRAYPDMILKGGALGKDIVAVDVKTGRRRGNRTGFTLGSYAGYFKNPDKKCSGCVRPYNDFSKHIAICFIYDWNPEADTLKMISNIKIIVHEKWKLASKSTGTGTTTAIGSVNDIDKLIKGEGTFKSKEEFLEYWKNYNRNKST